MEGMRRKQNVNALNSRESFKTTLEHRKNGEDPIKFDLEGLREIYSPFWADLPLSNIFLTITLDILHQLHKGVFKDHFVKWTTSLVREEAIDT